VNELENLRKRAKQIVRDHRAGLVTVAERLRQGLPRFAGMSDREVLDAPFSLHDAQLLVALERGFASWAALVAAPEVPVRPAPVREAPWRAFAQVFVRDVAVSLAWYRDTLGFAVDYTYGEPPFYAQVSRDAVAFNLRHTDASPWVADPTDDDLLAVRIEVGDVKALFLAARDRGATLHQRLRTEPWGQVTFIVVDPDGNLLGFGSAMS
jgi:catechol 2,3-dioxygenase-like lactoylglutathione lyase family enzyme